MSHGDKAEELPPGFELIAKVDNAVAAIQNAGEALLCGAVPSRGTPYPARHGRSCATSFSIYASSPRTGRRRCSSMRRSRRSRTGRHGTRHLWAIGRRRLVGRCGTGPSVRDWRSTHLHLREQWRSAQERVRKRTENLRDKLGLNIDAVDASEQFLGKLAGVTDPERNARSSATSSSPSSKKKRTVLSNRKAKSTG